MIPIEMTMKPDILSTAVKKVAVFVSGRERWASDAGAFQILLNPVKENLYNFILKALNFSEDAQDVYQETVLRAFKYKHTYDENRPFKTWLFTIAHNEIKRHFKKSGEIPGAAGTVEQLAHTPDDADNTWVRDIYDIAATLNPNQRKVFFLFYDQRFSIKEISRITGLRQGNIKFILNRARERIKEKLGIEGG
jgi:RNA polymerase sigma-70 factor (ECF subfamily)